MKILAVDDDEIICELLEGTLEVAGFKNVTTVSSPKDALTMIEEAETPFECFLLDIQMPEMTGIELCEWIRKQPNHKKTPIVMITAMSDKKHIDAAFRAGASDYVTKPFDTLELGTRIRIAADMVEQQKYAQAARQETLALKDTLRRTKQFDIHHAFHLDEVEGFVDFAAFEKYHLLLNRKEYMTSGLLALRIANVQDMYARSDDDTFRSTIVEIARVLSNVTKNDFDFLTYKGNGVFICSFLIVLRPDIEDLRLMLANELRGLVLTYDDGRKIPVDLELGDAIVPSVFSSPGSSKLLTRAVETLDRPASAELNGQSERGLAVDTLSHKSPRQNFFMRSEG